MKALEKDVAVTVWCNELDATREDKGNYDNIIVHSAKIKMLFATPSVPWVGMEVGEDLTEHMRKRPF